MIMTLEVNNKKYEENKRKESERKGEREREGEGDNVKHEILKNSREATEKRRI